MAIPIYYVDAFVVPGKAFSGNQAAICVLPSDDSFSDANKQALAAELNLSETAFVSRTWTKDGRQANEHSFTLRWFTPSNEVDLCGHATLATAAVVFERLGRPAGDVNETRVEFDTKFKGIVAATVDWATNRIRLDFPNDPPTPMDTKQLSCLPEILLKILEGNGNVSEVESVSYGAGTKKLLVRLRGDISEEHLAESQLLQLSPNFQGLMAIEGNDLVRGVIVTCKGSGDEVNFYSRYFTPWNGVNEDPVTGSAHTVLTPYWLDIYPNKKTIVGKQCSARSGHVHCKIDSKDASRVILEGSAKIIIRGELTL